MRQSNLISQRVSMFCAMCVAVFALSSCCLIYPSLPLCDPSGPYGATKRPGQAGQDPSAAAIARLLRAKANANANAKLNAIRTNGAQAGASTTSTLFPFYGNLQAVQAAPSNSFLLQRQADCSLGYGEFNITGTATAPVSDVTSTTPNYEKIIHNNAFLTTTPDTYPKGCGSTSQGTASAQLAYLGVAKTNGNFLGAAINGSTILSYSINASYAITVGPALTPDIAPYSVMGADLNGDGNIDLISTNTDGVNSSISVFISNGDGSYKAPANYELPAQVIAFGVVDDLNGDNKQDVMVNVENGGFRAFFGKGDGTFNASVPLSTGGQTAFFSDKFITADVNGDGSRDILTSEGQLFLGTGDGITYTFPGLAFPGVVNASNGLAPGIVVADFNNDNHMDIAVDDGNTISTYLSDGNGGFKAGPAYATVANRGLITGTDIDGDGNIDLYSGFGDTPAYGADDYLTNTGYPLMGKGDGTFAGAPKLPIVYTGTNLADLNGDGRPDLVGLVVGNNTQTLVTYLTGADGVPVVGPSLDATSPFGMDSYATGAFNTKVNTRPGLIWLDANPNGQTFNILSGNGDGSFSALTTLAAPSLVPAGIDIGQRLTGLHLADFNGDGKLDIAYSFTDQSSTTSLYYQGLAVQLGNGDGTFGDPQITYTYQGAAPVQAFQNMLSFVADVNKDGFADAFLIVPPTTVGNPYTVQLFIGTGDGSFKAPNMLNVTPTVFPPVSDGSDGTPFALADLNGDGKLDLVTGGSSADSSVPEIAITLGNGDGTFQPPTILKLGGFGYAGSPALGDFDGDGKLDLYVGGIIEGADLGIFPGKGDGTFTTIANSDGTVSAPDSVVLRTSGGAVPVDLNGDKLTDLIAGGVILLNKSNATPPVTAPTTLALTSSMNPAVPGFKVNFTATISSTTAGTFTGTVTFFDGGTQIGTGAVSMDGQTGVAFFSTTTLSAGNHTITAQYGGDANYSGSTSPAVIQSISNGALAVTTTSLASSLNPSTVGVSVTFTATVVPTAPSGSKPGAIADVTAATPTGSVTFKDGATTIGTGTLSAGVATFSTAVLAQGTHSITAVYGGDTTYATSTSPAVSQVVNAATGKATTSTTIVSATNPSVHGAPVQFTATVTSGTAGTIGGIVTFYSGSSNFGTAPVGAGGVAVFSTSALPSGANAMTAHYSGDSTYASSVSTVLTQNVSGAPTTPTSTSLSATPTSGAAGTSIAFTATVAATATTGVKKSAAQALPAVTGTVTFLDGATSIGTGSVGAGGLATFSTTALAAGTHTVTASYGGDANYSASVSGAVTITITGAGTFTVSASPASLIVTKSTPGSSTITVTPAGGFSAPVTLACAGLPAGFSCAFAPATVTPGAAPATSTLTIAESSAAMSARHSASAGNSGGGAGFTGTPRFYAFAFGGELALFGLLFTRRRRLFAYGAGRVAFAVMVCALAITFMAGCSGGSGTQMVSVSVNATSGTQTVSTPISVILPK